MEAIVKARRGIGIICFLSKYVTHDVLDQIYKLYALSIFGFMTLRE